MERLQIKVLAVVPNHRLLRRAATVSARRGAPPARRRFAQRVRRRFAKTTDDAPTPLPYAWAPLAPRGAVTRRDGLQHANRLALSDDVTRPLLLLEDDCVFKDPQRLALCVRALAKREAEFDLAAFGVFYAAQRTRTPVEFLPEGWVHAEDMFWGLHCVLYSSHGRKLLAEQLARPFDMQIDSLYGSLARSGVVRRCIELGHHTAGSRCTSPPFRRGCRARGAGLARRHYSSVGLRGGARCRWRDGSRASVRVGEGEPIIFFSF